MAVTVCAISGCKGELFVDLDRPQASEIVAALSEWGIQSECVLLKNAHYAVKVDEKRAAEALDLLNMKGLPRLRFNTLCSMLGREFPASPKRESAQTICSLVDELSRNISKINGVISARVHLISASDDPLHQPLITPSAFIFIRHWSSASADDMILQAKMLVVKTVKGLSDERISVSLIPVSEQVLAMCPQTS